MSFMTTTLLLVMMMIQTNGQGDCPAGFGMYGRKYCLHWNSTSMSAVAAATYCHTKGGATLPYLPAGDSLTIWQKAVADASPSIGAWGGASYVNGTGGAGGWLWTAAAVAAGAGATPQGVVPQQAWEPGEPYEGDGTCTTVGWSGKLLSWDCSNRQEVLCQVQQAVIDCGQLQSPQNGRVIGEGHVKGDKVIFECDIGHELVGADGASCLDTGRWSVQIPQCKRGCPVGFKKVDIYCFHYIFTEMRAGEAGSYCSTKGGATLPYLPAGDSLTQWQKALADAIPDGFGYGAWGGASYVSGVAGGWLWTAAAGAGATPQVVPQQAWVGPSQPSGDGRFPCTRVSYSSGKLVTMNCNYTASVLCQVQASE